MRDIRCDLQERLELTVEQRAELEKRLRALEEREQRLRALLRDEGGQGAGSPYEQPLLSLGIPTDTATGARLREFVLQALSDGHERNLNDLKKQAQGIALTTAGASGRSLNIILVNLHRRGLVTRLPNGKWRRRADSRQLALDLEPQPSSHTKVALESEL